MNTEFSARFHYIHERYKELFSRLQRAKEGMIAELGDYNAFLQWEKEYINKLDTPSTIELFVMIRSARYSEYITVSDLAPRYGVPYATIKTWVENETIKTEVLPARNSKIDSNTGEIYPNLRLFVRGEFIHSAEETEYYFKQLKESAKERNYNYNLNKEHAYSEVAKALLSGVENEYGSVENFFSAVISSLERDNKESENIKNDHDIKLLLLKIRELEKKLSDAAAQPHDDKGLSGLVCRMRREGKSDEEIAAYLYDGGTWCTQAQIGALLHADDSRVASESMQQRARRLLGKA